LWDARPTHDILHLKYASWQHVKKDCFQVLCLSPTYELAIQTGEVAAKMAQFCPEIKIRFAVRGEESK
jgi:superfamily II DNA/RNA helicase